LFLAVVVITVILLPAYSQNEQATYLKAKAYLDEGSYAFAMENFRKLAEPNQKNPFKEYASFYFALAAYKNDQLGLARSMWLQMGRKNSRWEKISEVYFWLAQVYFEEANPGKGVYYSKKSELPAADGLMNEYLNDSLDIDTMEKIHYQYPNDQLIAFKTAQAIHRQSLTIRNFQLLNYLVEKFGFDKRAFGIPDIGESQMKQAYNVAVLMPFLFDSLGNTRRVERNRFVMDMYVGILEAADTLNTKGAKINILPYDTKRSKSKTQNILLLPELITMDLIIGPLFPEPSKIVNNFCYENKINMINPVSTNAAILANNPYAFLFKSSTTTQALTAANMAIEQFSNNKTVMIIYEDNKQDSINAFTYSQKIQESGFDVIETFRVRDTTVKAVFDYLTSEYEVEYTKAEADSLMETKERSAIVKERKSRVTKDSIEYYATFLTIAPDSIGHVYVASSKPIIASNIISAIEVRGDSTGIIGRGKWKEFDILTFEQLQRLGVYFVDADYIRKDRDQYKFYRDRYVEKFKRTPGLNNLVGYELMYFVGSMMQRYGNYFQKGNPQVGFTKGQLLYGTYFGYSNNNQAVPITQFVDAEIKILNDR